MMISGINPILPLQQDSFPESSTTIKMIAKIKTSSSPSSNIVRNFPEKLLKTAMDMPPGILNNSIFYEYGCGCVTILFT